MRFSTAECTKYAETLVESGNDRYRRAGDRSPNLRRTAASFGSTLWFDFLALSVISCQQASKREVFIQVGPVNAVGRELDPAQLLSIPRASRGLAATGKRISAPLSIAITIWPSRNTAERALSVKMLIPSVASSSVSSGRHSAWSSSCTVPAFGYRNPVRKRAQVSHLVCFGCS